MGRRGVLAQFTRVSTTLNHKFDWHRMIELERIFILPWRAARPKPIKKAIILINKICGGAGRSGRAVGPLTLHAVPAF